MPNSVRTLLFLCPFLLISHISFSQERFSLRKLLNRVHINASMGYGSSWYSHQVVHVSGDLNGASIVFKEGDKFYVNTGDPGVVYLIQWFDGSYVRMPSYTDLRNPSNGKKAVNQANFKGKGTSIPIVISSHVDLWEKMRVGLGGAFFINTLERLEHEEKDQEKNLGVYTPSQKRHYQVRPFAILGFKVVENSILSVIFDTNLGFDFIYPASEWKCIAIFNSGVQNVGITIEGNVSEYVRLFGRLSYERSNLLSTLDKEDKAAIVLEKESILFQLGFSFNCPEIPRCSLPGCEVERKHKHGGKSYRGVSIFTTRDAQGRRLYKR